MPNTSAPRPDRPTSQNASDPTAAERWQVRFQQLAHQPAVHLAMLYALALGRRWWELNQRPFWIDELLTLAYTQLPFPAFAHLVSINSNMSIYFMLMFGWVRLVGVGADEALLRLPSIVLSAAAAPAVYLLGRRLLSPALGLIAGGLLAIHGYHAILSRENRSYGLFSLLVVVSYLRLVEALRSGRRRDWLLLGLINGLTCYCHIYAVFLICAQVVFVLLRRSRTALHGVLLSSVVAAALVLPLVPWALNGSTSQRLSVKAAPDLEDLAPLFAVYAGGTDRVLPALYLVLMIVGLAPWIWRRSASALTFNRQLLLSWLLVPPALVLGISQVRMIFAVRYLFPIVPALTLLAAWGLLRLPRSIGLGVGALVTVLALNVPWSSFPSIEVENWRDAVHQTASAARPDDGWVFSTRWAQQAFEYYAGWQWGRNPSAPYANIVEPFDWSRIVTFAGYSGPPDIRAFEGFAAPHPRIWVVDFHASSRNGNLDPVWSWLAGQSYVATSQRAYAGVTIWLFTRPSPP